MNFTRKLKSVITAVFVLFAVVLALGSCKIGLDDIAEYTITYDANAGENAVTGSVDSKKAKEGESITVAENAFEIEDKVFIEWNTKADGSGTSYKPGDTITLTSDITLFAQWRDVAYYSVTFDTDGGNSIEGQSVRTGSKVTKPDDPEKTGFTFQYWMLGDSEFDFDTPITEAIELTAYFTINSYKVTFISEGVKVSEPSVEYNNKVSAPAEEPKKTGHTFQYWKLGDTEYNFDTPITEAIELTAYFTINSYKVEILVDGVKLSERLVVYNNLVDEAYWPETPINDAKIFECWYLNNAPFDFASDTIVDNSIITAHWKTVPENNVVVTYKDENLNILSQSFEPKNTIIQPISVAARDGYSFMGWLNGENIFNFAADTLSENTVFVQKWEPNILLFQITLESMAGNNTIELTYDETSKTFTAADGYTNYTWKIDGRVLQGAAARTLILTDYDSQIETGKRQLLVNAKKDGRIYSASATITIKR